MRPSKGLEACVDVVFIFCQSASPSAFFTPPCLCIFSAVFFCSFIIHMRLPSLSARPPRLATKSLNPLLRGVYQPCAVTQSSDRRVCHLHRVTGSLVNQTDRLAASAPISSSHSRTRENRYTFFLPHFRDLHFHGYVLTNKTPVIFYNFFYLKKGSCFLRSHAYSWRCRHIESYYQS